MKIKNRFCFMGAKAIFYYGQASSTLYFSTLLARYLAVSAKNLITVG
jgi:hypothetical protein